MKEISRIEQNHNYSLKASRILFQTQRMGFKCVSIAFGGEFMGDTLEKLLGVRNYHGNDYLFAFFFLENRQGKYGFREKLSQHFADM